MSFHQRLSGIMKNRQYIDGGTDLLRAKNCGAGDVFAFLVFEIIKADFCDF